MSALTVAGKALLGDIVSQPYQQQAAPQQGHAAPAGHAVAPQGPAGVQMKKRNPVGAWLGLPIITLGIYGIVWYYLVHSELANFDRRRPISPGMAICSVLFGTITLGIWPLVTWVKLGGHIRNAQQAAGLQPSCSGGLGFLLGILGFGVLYYQIELNKVINRYGDTPAGTQVPLAA
jgi:drug/metabolite transporter (DMT)-like permease